MGSPHQARIHHLLQKVGQLHPNPHILHKLANWKIIKKCVMKIFNWIDSKCIHFSYWVSSNAAWTAVKITSIKKPSQLSTYKFKKKKWKSNFYKSTYKPWFLSATSSAIQNVWLFCPFHPCPLVCPAYVPWREVNLNPAICSP